MSKIEKTHKVSFYAIIGKIGDILLWPVLIVAFCSSFFMLVQRQQNKVTSFLGYSFCNVLSKSMENDGFYKGDTVIVKNVNEKDVKLGDIIAFYSHSNKHESDSNIHLVVKYINSSFPLDNDSSNIKKELDISSIEKTKDNREQNLKKAQDAKASVIFHTVVGIFVDNDGNVFYKTKGSSNGSSDSTLAPSDLVVGKYINTPVFFRRAVSYCASPIGMIILVCLPLSLLVLMQCLSLIEQISIISLEKKLISGQLSYKDEEIKKDLPGSIIELYNKVYYYFMAPDEEKEEVKNYLWGDLYNNISLKPSQAKELALVNYSINILKNSGEAYWDYWIENTKGSIRKKLLKLKNEVDLKKLCRFVNEYNINKQQNIDTKKNNK